MSDPQSLLETLIEAAESAAGRFLTARILAGAGILAGAWYYGIAAWFVGVFIVAPLIHYGDVLGFMLIDGWKSTAQGKIFLEAAKKRLALPKDASDEEREKAEAAELAAFTSLVDMGHA